MFRSALLIIGTIIGVALGFTPIDRAPAQNTTCSDRPASDVSNACANTRFTHSAITTNCVVFTDIAKGCVPASGGGTINYLRADGTFAPPGIGTTVRSSSAATVTISINDYFLCLDPTSNAIAANLPNSPTTGQTFVIKDCTGQAHTNTITINPATGNIDGQSAAVIALDYAAITVTYTGAQWSIQ